MKIDKIFIIVIMNNELIVKIYLFNWFKNIKSQKNNK